jgi:alcohol dehydrogenase YqhD (iron-dependent ADH family)
MQDFVFHHPVKIIFGANGIDKLGTEMRAVGCRPLFVFGNGSIRENRLYDRVIEQLGTVGINAAEFGGVRPNPLLSTVRQGIAAARAASCDSILAVGGGSVIDTAKAIAAGVAVNHDIWKFFTGGKTVRSSLPLVTVPTVAGSGSEINHGMVLTHDERGHKFGFAHRLLYPQVCLAVPSLTATVPAKQTAYGAVDALSHCLEPYLSSEAEEVDFQFAHLENICRSIVTKAPRCINQPDCYSDRSAMLWLSMMAMSPAATAGLGRVYHSLHTLEHGLSARYNIAHGAGLAALLPGWLRYNQVKWGKRICRWGEQVLCMDQQSAAGSSEAVITGVTRYLDSLGCPVTLSQLAIPRNEIPLLADHVEAQTGVRAIPGLEREQALAILESCW